MNPSTGGGYDAFSTHAAPMAGATSLQMTSTMTSSAAPPSTTGMSGLLSGFSLSDESACDWVMRDSAAQTAPQVLRQLQGGISLWKMFHCWSEEEYQQRQHTPDFLDTKLLIGDVLELHGATGTGKTELLYQSLLHTIMPKSVASTHLNCTMCLGGRDSGCVFFDFDSRFSMTRLEQLLRAHINRAAKKSLRSVIQLPNIQPLPGHDLQTEMEDLYQQQSERLLDQYFKSDEYVELRRHCWSSFFVFHAQTPQQALVALCEAETVIQDFGRISHKRSWLSKEKAKLKVKTDASATTAIEVKDDSGDIEMNEAMDPSNPLYDPTISASTLAAAAASASSTAAATPPRITLCLIDNIAAFFWLVHNQRTGHAGIGTGLYSAERKRVNAQGGLGASMCANQRLDRIEAHTYKNPSSWFYELFTQQLRYLLGTYHMSAVVTKPAFTAKHFASTQTLGHEESLGLSWNYLVTYRIVMRDEKEQIKLKNYVPGTREFEKQRTLLRELAAYGVLRGALLKDIHASVVCGPSATNTVHRTAMMEFKFRIGTDGIKPKEMAIRQR